MSRRKQSAPCKVGGHSPSNENDEDLSSSPFTSMPYDDEDSKSSSPQSLLQNHRMSIGLKAYSIASTDTSTCQDESFKEDVDSGHSMEDVKTLCLSNYSKSFEDLEPKNKRFSARIRAKVISKSQTLMLKTNSNLKSSHILHKSQQLGADQVNEAIHGNKLENKGRKLSCEEELTCPICYKTFMSRYGLLTHTEVHGTPELKCHICNLGFSRRSAFVAHQVHYHGEEKYTDDDTLFQVQNAKEKNGLSVPTGFSDLSFIDFTCNKFSAIAGNLCVQRKHQLTEKDRRHFFMCKKCDVLFPTLFVLKFHLKSCHSANQGNSALSKLTISGKTYILNSSFGVSVDTAGNNTNPSSILNSLMSRSFMQSLQLKSLNEKEVPCANKPCAYGVDDPTIRTSPLIAYLSVPHWLRNNDAQKTWCGDSEQSIGKPSLKLKLLRCKPIQSSDSMSSLVTKSYSINKDTVNRIKNSSCSCALCGEQFPSSRAVEAHRAGTACGIGVRTSSNGRKLFWCRLCNYASFEKSTILRHQRTHTGIRPYSCKFCSLAFTTKANCERHIRKRHQSLVVNETDVKSSVDCDQELLKQARSSAEVSCAPQHDTTPTQERIFRFRCRMCKAMFSSRSNGARHVMDKHGVFSRKGANELITGMFTPARSPNEHAAATGVATTTQSNTIMGQLAGSGQNIPRNPNNLHTTLKTAPKRHMVVPAAGTPVKIPRLIPLEKIQAYNKTAHKLHDHFRNKYSDILESMGITEYNKDGKDIRKMSSTLVSLLASASSLLIDNAIRKNQPISHDLPYGNTSDNAEPSAEFGDTNDLLASVDTDDRHWESSEVSERDASYHDLVQLYADGKWENQAEKNDDYDEFKFLSSGETPKSLRSTTSSSNNNLMELSPSDDDEKDSPSDLTSIKKLVDFVRQPGPIVNGYNNASNNKEREPKSRKDEVRGKYRMVALKPKTTETLQLNSGLAWKFIPYPPEMRDEKGRYMKMSDQTKSPLSSTKSIPYLTDLNRPTMVSMVASSNSKVGTSFEEKRARLFDGNRGHYRTRKCPKCDKTFPWASSLRRHIMTHTGLKPYMCARCSMRFTTRSNLLRHAYRRHNVSRAADERQQVLIALTPRQQQEYAVTEAEETLANPEQQTNEDESNVQDGGESPADGASEVTNEKNPKTQIDSASKKETDQTNKRFSCGLCGALFANRSNVVRHLYRLHNITKDDNNFRSLLVKIEKQPTQRAPPVSSPPAAVTSTDVDTKAKIETEEVVEEQISKAKQDIKSDNCPDESPAATTTPNKAFRCTICSVGFTKRNNAARHVQQQHHISRHRSNFSQLIERLNNSPEMSQDEQLAETPVAKRPERSSSDVKPSTEQLSKALKMHTTPSTPAPLWRSRRMAAKRKLNQASGSNAEPTSTKTREYGMRKSKSTHFVCGVCKRIFKEVTELKEHIEEHNIPHPWVCTLCGVPFTNKYNCQRHLLRCHGEEHVEPKYVEDVRCGPPHPRKRSRKYW